MKRICVLLCICLPLAALLIYFVQPEENNSQKRDIISCVAFGDSIAKGYAGQGGDDLKSYPELLMEKISEETDIPSECLNYAQNGLDLAGLNSVVFSGEEVLASLETADIITLTIGANDLLREFKKAVQEGLGAERGFTSIYDAMDVLEKEAADNPLLLAKLLDVLYNWDYKSFEEQWVMAMETITGRRKEASQLIVTNIYDPVSRYELPGSMEQMVQEIILNMNEIMYQYAEKYDYCVADVFSSEICDYLQEDGLHPSQEGQELIAGLVFEKTEPEFLCGGKSWK